MIQEIIECGLTEHGRRNKVIEECCAEIQVVQELSKKERIDIYDAYKANKSKVSDCSGNF